MSIDTALGCTTAQHILFSSFWQRVEKIRPLSASIRDRFLQCLEHLFEAHQALSHATDTVPDLEEYIELRRDTSGCSAAFVLMEWASGIRLPADVVEDPVIRGLVRNACDLVAWAEVSCTSAGLASN